MMRWAACCLVVGVLGGDAFGWAVPVEDGFVPLFDGQSLAGWQVVDGPEGSFRARQGVLECTGRGGPPGWLRTEKTYENFILRFDYRLGYYAESGLVLHAPLHGRLTRVGIGIKICEDTAPGAASQHCGSIVGVLPPRVVATDQYDVWVPVEVSVDYPMLRVTIHGKTVQDLDVTQHEKMRYKLRSGYIGLQDMGKRTRFRNLRIKPLPAQEHWTPLFNGKTLDGFEKIGEARWEIDDGVLRASNGNGYVVTDADYRDFVLFTYVRTSRHANGGIFYRWKSLVPKDRGYEIQIENLADSNNPTGSIYTLSRADTLTVRDEEWFPMQIFAKGPTTVVRVNGETVATANDLKLVRAGRIALQMHRRNAWVEFKDVRIRSNP